MATRQRSTLMKRPLRGLAGMRPDEQTDAVGTGWMASRLLAAVGLSVGSLGQAADEKPGQAMSLSIGVLHCRGPVLVDGFGIVGVHALAPRRHLGWVTGQG